jgi:hypothetical protein
VAAYCVGGLRTCSQREKFGLPLVNENLFPDATLTARDDVTRGAKVEIRDALQIRAQIFLLLNRKMSADFNP